MDREMPILRADDMGRHASAFVERATAKARLPLDYTAASLRVVDRLVDGLRRGGARREDVAGPLLGIGAYVGEVLAHEAGAVWVDIPRGTSCGPSSPTPSVRGCRTAGCGTRSAGP